MRTWPVGVVRVPDVTSVAAVTVVFPSNRSRVKRAQDVRCPSCSSFALAVEAPSNRASEPGMR